MINLKNSISENELIKEMIKDISKYWNIIKLN